jgi:hypothetical protein
MTLNQANLDIHEFIINTVRSDAVEIYTEYISTKTKLNLKESDISNKALLGHLFINYRHTKYSGHKGLRLIFNGMEVMNKHFESYLFVHDSYPFSKQLFVKLDRKMIWPYYVSKNFIVFYSSTEAAWFTLNGSDLKQFVECL